jgi:hypothetical protein
MIFTASARRISACAIGIVAAAALTVACSSSTAGTADTSGAAQPPASASISASLPASLPASVPVSLPTSLPVSLPASLPASIPTLGGSQVCKDLSSLGNIGNSLSGGSQDKLNSFLAGLDKVVAEAPAEIKPDLQTLDDYVHGAVTGHVDPTIAQKLPTIEQHLISYITANCHA